MPRQAIHADAFTRFMKIVTEALLPEAPEPDPHEVRIGELERRVKAMQRSMRKRAKRRKPA